jgi:hypothetical protein
MAANERAAHSAHGGGGGDGGGGGGGGTGGSSRSPKELLPGVIVALQKMTGETFKNPGAVIKWIRTHVKDIEAKNASLDVAEKDQKTKPK